MVRFEDFELTLVRAEPIVEGGTEKEPFQEHQRYMDNKVYVEVEPEVDYYIGVRQVTDELTKP